MIEKNCIYHQNCMEGLKLLDNFCIDLTVTSPPYDHLRDYCGYDVDFEIVISELYRVTREGGVVVWIVADQTVNGSETGSSFRQALYFLEQGFKLHDTMIWRKNSYYTHKNRYISCFEYMFVFSKGKPKTTNIICDRKNIYAGTRIHGKSRQVDGSTKVNSGTRCGRTVKEYGMRFNVWDIPPDRCNHSIHPAVFPVRLARDHIVSWSSPGELVLDPFMGSGTTAVACIQEDRDFIGFEIEKTYCDYAEGRVQQAFAERSICIGQ